ncbi:MAG: molecular chaperone DnaJ [Nitrospinaceae bacterium]
MPALTPIVSPEEEELQQKRQELVDLEQELADKELELSTLKGELNLFERRYNQVLGAKYAELDEIKAQVLELACRFYPRSDEFRAEARTARERARKSADHSENAGSEEPPEEDFQPSEALKKLFREVAKKIHPDLASNATQKAHRHELMARLNQAYDRLDEEGIRAILIEWEASQPAEANVTLGTRLVRTVRQIAQIRKRLNRIRDELEELTHSGMFQLMKKVESAGEAGTGLLREMAEAVQEKIVAVKSRVRDLAHEFD